MIRGLKERHPDVHIKALTAVEIAHLARIEKTSEREVLLAHARRPGSPACRAAAPRCSAPRCAPPSPSGSSPARSGSGCTAWPTSSGIPTNCTMLYGHVETRRRPGRAPRHAARRCRTRPAASSPTSRWPTTPSTTSWARSWGASGTATTGYEDLKNIAVGRLFLDNIPHVKTHWPMVTPFMSQMALAFGCDDVEGTVVYERIYHEAGATTAMHMPYAGLVGLIRGAGQAAGGARQPLPVGARATSTTSPRRRSPPARGAAAGGARRMRLGRIPWINCYPVYGAIDRGIVPLPRGAGDRHRRRAQRPAGRRRARRERRLGRRVRPQRRRLSPAARPRDHLRRPGAQRARCSPGGRSTSWTARRCCSPPRPGPRCCCSSCSAAIAGRWPRASPPCAPRRPTSTRCAASRTTRCW